MEKDIIKVLVTLPVKDKHRAQLIAAAPEADFRFIPSKELTENDVADIDVSVGNIPLAFMPSARCIKLLHLGSAGTDGYQELMPEGAFLTNSSGAYGLAISEHMLGMTLAVIKKLYLYQDNQRECLWHDEGPVTSMEDAVVLTVGLGNIGGDFAKKCKALGSYTIGVRRNVGEKPAYIDELYSLAELDTLLPRADIVALSLPSGAETKGLMTQARLRLMKQGALLVNVGRGNAIDTSALQEVCAEGRIHAALDVTDPEPLPADHPLWKTPNVHITPHISGFFHLSQTLDRIVSIGAENLRRFIAGEELLNLVDPATGYRREENRA